MLAFILEALFVGAFIVWFIFYAIGFLIPYHWKRYKCKHTKFYETQACQAVCSDCGKELGFIGIVRKDKSCEHL